MSPAPGPGYSAELPDAYHVRLESSRADHLGYFDPAEGPVPNPGMGVTGYVVSDHMHCGYTEEEWQRTEKEPPRPLDRATVEEMAALPCVDNLYIRVEWREVQQERGKLALPDAWKWLLECVARTGKGWGFRVMPCSPHSVHASGLPEYLEGRLPVRPYWRPAQFSGGPKYFPDYTPGYLDHWQELLGLLGEAFDGHPTLEFVDVSGFGFWGELHHWASHRGPDAPHENYEPPGTDGILARLIRDHLQAFPRTPAALGLHAAECAAGREAFQRGLCWGRRDSFMTNYSPAEAMLTQGLAPGHGMVWEVIRPGLRCPVDGTAAAPGRYPLPQRYFDTQAHHAAVGFNPWDMIWAHRHCRKTLDALERHLGYRIRPSVVWTHQVGGDGRTELVLGLRNDGCAQVPGVLCLGAEFSNGQVRRLELPPGEPVPGRMHYAAIPCDGVVPAGFQGTVRFTLALRLKGRTRPVQWAVAGEGPSPRLALEVPFRDRRA